MINYKKLVLFPIVILLVVTIVSLFISFDNYKFILYILILINSLIVIIMILIQFFFLLKNELMIKKDSNYFSGYSYLSLGNFIHTMSFSLLVLGTIVIIVNYEDINIKILAIIYIVVFIIHFFASNHTNTFYFGPNGVKLNIMNNELVKYEDIKLISYEPNNLPFRGLENTHNIIFKHNDKIYKTSIRDENLDILLFRLNLIKKENETNKSIKENKSNLIVNIIQYFSILITIIGFAGLFIGGGFFNKTDNVDYTKVSSKEFKPLSIISSIAIDSNDLLYVYYNDFDTVNVYNLEGEFIYSISITPFSNGRGKMRIIGDTLYLVNGAHQVFEYKNGVFIQTKDEETYNDIEFVYDTLSEVKGSNGISYFKNYFSVFYVENNAKYTIISRTPFLILFDHGFSWIIGVIGFTGIFVTQFILNRNINKDKNYIHK